MQAKFGFVMLLCMAALVALFAPHAEAVISCGQVQRGMAPCLGFLQGRALAPKCCAGVKAVAASARTVLDRRAACRCLVAAAKSMKGINYGNAARLPGKCGVRISFPISPNTDCSRYIQRFRSFCGLIFLT